MPASVAQPGQDSAIQMESESLLVSNRGNGKTGRKVSYDPTIHGSSVTLKGADLKEVNKMALTVPPNSRIVVAITMPDSTSKTLSFENIGTTDKPIKATPLL